MPRKPIPSPRSQDADLPKGSDTAHAKLHKVLADAGLGSRRELEGWISRGRVTVNSEVAHVGQRVSPEDRIEVDGRRIRTPATESPQVLVLNKSGGVVCTRKDTEGRPTVFDELPKLRHGRWVSVGRLDIQTTGLLVLTNDGSLAHKMMHPSTGLDREYAVRVNAELEDDVLKTLMAGVEVEGEQLRFSDIRFFNGSGTNFWYHVVLMEGKNREVRRLFEAVGCTVSRLKRVRYGPIILPSWLKNKQWAFMQDEDVQALYRLLNLRYVAPRKTNKSARTAQGKPRVSRHVAKSTCLLPYPELPTRR